MPTFPPVDEQLAYIKKGSAEIVKESELRSKLEKSLASGKPLRVKAGFDPTAPDIHLGHTVVLHRKRGHLKEPVDLLSVGRKQIEFAGKKIKSNSTHGTGCAFATSLACNLARGIDLKDSVKAAGQYVRRAILRAYPIGKGKGPINHLYGMREA